MAGGVVLKLLDNASESGSAVSWPGGKGTFVVDGTFGGAEVKLQRLSPDGSSYIDVDATNASFTAEGMCQIEMAGGTVKAAVSGGSPSALYATLTSIGD